jgi:hypothetical protein
MSGTEVEETAAGSELNAEQVEDRVMDKIPTLTAGELEEICTLVNIQVDTMRGKKSELRRTLLKHLCGDDTMADLLAIHTRLFPDGDAGNEDNDGEQPINNEVKVETDTVQQNQPSLEATRPVPNPLNNNNTTSTSRRETTPITPATNPQRSEMVQISRHRLRDLKLPGMIGGEGENALSFCSLEFEVRKARNLGYRDEEICAAIIPKVADREMRTLLEMEEEIDLDEMLDMLKSTSEEVRDSGTVFADFSNTSQGEHDPTEKISTFITRLHRLRKEIETLGKAEGVSYSADMLMKRGFRVLIDGIRDEGIRNALRERCGGDYKLTKAQLLKHAAEVVAQEKERKARLFGKPGDKKQVDVNAVTDGTGENAARKKEKLNPFVKIEELRSDMTTQLNEIKNMVMAHNNRNDNTPPNDVMAQLNEIRNMMANHNIQTDTPAADNRRRRPYKRCPQCIADNRNTCGHCWKCGSGTHKQQECTENE